MQEARFFRCNRCGNTSVMLHMSKGTMTCCGEDMTELIAGVVEASREKHIPVVTRDGNQVLVAVGSIDHPMIPEHYIEWIYLHTTRGGQWKALNPNEAPKATFTLEDEEPIAVYAYCNLHGLWKASI